jgi:hypothetical protein
MALIQQILPNRSINAATSRLVPISPQTYNKAATIEVKRVVSPSDVTYSQHSSDEILNNRVIRWLLRRELLDVRNIIWLMIGIGIGLAILATTITLLIVRIRQVNYEAESSTPLPGRFVSEPCTLSSDCLENGFCNGATCQCVPDFYYDQSTGQCLTLKTYGTSCIDSTECDYRKGLSCFFKICSCPISTVWANYYGTNECVRIRQIGETCQSSGHCIATSYCAYSSTSSAYRCLCIDGYFPHGKQNLAEIFKNNQITKSVSIKES